MLWFLLKVMMLVMFVGCSDLKISFLVLLCVCMIVVGLENERLNSSMKCC